MDTNVIETTAAAITPGETDLQQVLQFRGSAKWLVEFATRMEAIADNALLAHILATGKPVTIGETLMVAAAYRKDVKCVNPKALLDTLFTVTGGDMEKVAACLASNAWKHGACREPLGDRFDEFFVTTSVPYLKDGVPTKKLGAINTNFLK